MDERATDRTAPADDGPDLAAPADDGPDLAAIGWATIDLGRAAVDLGLAVVPLPADELLGATAGRAVVRPGSRGAGATHEAPLILLEPATEGRLAA